MNFETNSIDFYKLLNDLKKFKKEILYTIFIFFVTSSIISLLLPIRYSSSILFVPDLNSRNTTSSASLSSIASIAGFSIDDPSNNFINPSLYPMILKDISFKRKILNIKLDSSELTLKNYLLDRNLSIFEYYNYWKSINYSDKKIIDHMFISNEESYLFSTLDEFTDIDIDIIDGYFNLKFKLDNPVYSTIVVKKIYELLEEKIKQIKIKSYSSVLENTIKNMNIKKREFEIIQEELAEFNDNNQSISSKKFNNEKFKLENKYNLAYNVYTQLANKVEEAKILVLKNTPIFSVIQSPYVPDKRIYPKRTQLVLIWSFIGFVISLIYIQIKISLSEKN